MAGQGAPSPHVGKAVMEEEGETQACSGFPTSKDYVCVPGDLGGREKLGTTSSTCFLEGPRCGGRCQPLLAL